MLHLGAMRPLLLLAPLVLSACSAVGPGGGFDVEADPPTLILDNNSDQTVYYVALESETATRLDLNPDVTVWPVVEVGQAVRIAYEDLDGYEEGDTEAVVYWSTGADFHQVRVDL